MDFFYLISGTSVNYWSVLVAAIVGMLIGALWYSPLLFGETWIKLAGLSKAMKPQQKSMTVQYSLGFLSQLVMATVLAHISGFVLVIYVGEALQLAFWLWLGFLATTMLGTVLWEMKSPKFYAINAGYWLVTLMLMSVILTVWPW
jgi:hypothetical protein